MQFLQGLYLLGSNLPESISQQKIGKSDHKSSGFFFPFSPLSCFLSALFYTMMSTGNSIGSAFTGDRDISRSERSCRHPGRTKTPTKASRNLLTPLFLSTKFLSPLLFLPPSRWQLGVETDRRTEYSRYGTYRRVERRTGR